MVCQLFKGYVIFSVKTHRKQSTQVLPFASERNSLGNLPSELLSGGTNKSQKVDVNGVNVMVIRTKIPWNFRQTSPSKRRLNGKFLIEVFTLQMTTGLTIAWSKFSKIKIII